MARHAGPSTVPARTDGGRFDRVDLIVMGAILLVALIARGFRLDEPRAMYFDEVYHARTATEFLQDWRYGEPHDIYEWTHPHLAKYAMAVSIALLGDDRVIDTGAVGVAVSDAIVQRPGILWVGGADGVVSMHDGAATSHPVKEPVSALAFDADTGLLYAATSSRVTEIDTADPVAARTLFEQDGIRDVALAGDGIVTLNGDGSVRSWTLDGTPVASALVEGGTVLSPAAQQSLIVADTTQVTDPAAEAQTLTDITGDDPSTIETQLRSGAPLVVLSVAPSADTTKAITDAADALPGIQVESRPLVAVGMAASFGTTATDGIRLLDATTLVPVSDLSTDQPVVDMTLVPSLDQPTLFVGGGNAVSTVSLGDDGPRLSDPLTLPGPVTKLVWNESANLVHAATQTAAGQPTIAVIEPQGLTLFADATLPLTPAALVVQDRPDVPSAPVRVLALAADGTSATIDGGSNAWAWRLPGVLAGALTVLCLYVLARFVSRRRSVGLAVAGLALLDGMMFVTARIAMNDVYVTLFITAAVTLFAAAWTGRWRRPWAVGGALAGVGLLLGLALASKWVGVYAIGGIGLLLLSRSGVGRVLILLGMLAATAVLGAAAITPADVPDPSMNWTFLLLMLALTGLVGAAMVRRPLPLEPNELRNVGASGVVLGALGLAAGLAGGSTTLAVLGALTGFVGAVAVLLRRVPAIASREAPNADDTPGFLLPGRGYGVTWLLALGCLSLIPIAVYVVSYLPWVALGNQLVAGVPGTDGQTLLDLTTSMYQYHDQLRATHAASSPWWAWMLDLKPVWMYLGDMAGGLTGNIFDAANPLILWSSIGGLVFTGVAAWRQRRPAYALVLVMFLSLWLPWARIDRAAFQYHLTGSLPFALLALALLLSAMWHRSSDLALTIGRVTIVGISFLPAALWFLRGPLCDLSGVSDPVLCATGGSGVTTGVVLAAIGCIPASLAWRSYNGRHLVIGLVMAMFIVSVALYPSLSGLPMDGSMTRWVTGLLPTWDYGWQFSVNQDPPVERSLLDLTALTVGLIAVTVTGVSMTAASRWDLWNSRRGSAARGSAAR